MKQTIRTTKNKHIAEPWDQQLVRRVGAAMKRARGAKSARWLSEETAALGHEISPTILAKLDSGHRGSVLNVIELLVLAAALNMPPVLLLFPGYAEGDIEFLPGHTAPCRQVVDWFSGRGRLPLRPGDENEVGPWNLGIELVQAVERYSEAVRNMLAAQAMSEDAPIRAEILRDMEQQLVELAARINELRRELEEEN